MKRIGQRICAASFVSVVALFSGLIRAQPVEWPIAVGGNGHLYEPVVANNITWEDARIAAGTAGGYLATITSATENAFVYSLVDGRPEYWNGTGGGVWLGGFQPEGSPEPAGSWQWVTGEPFLYTNWYPGEPSNSHSIGEDCLHFWNGDTWNDAYRFDPTFMGYMMEYAAAPGLLEAEIDIKPGSYPNSVNPGSKGVIPLAVLGGEDFDVSEIDLPTVKLEGVRSRPRGKSGKVGSFVDINGDSFRDLMLHFETEELGIDSNTAELTLVGLLTSGIRFEGSDSIRIVPPLADMENSDSALVSSAMAIPEPVTLMLVAAGGLFALRRRRTR